VAGGQIERPGEVQVRDDLGELGDAGAEQRELGRAGRGDLGEHAAQHAGQLGHHVEVIGDEAELDVEAGVLVDVPGGVVRFGPEHRTDLVHPLEHADHDLLVKLGALRQVRRAAEVVDREHVGAALGRGLDQLGRLDLDEALGVERGAKPAHRGGADPEDRAALREAVGHHGVVEQRRHRHVGQLLAELHGRGLRRLGDHVERDVAELDAVRRLRLRAHLAGHGDHRLGLRRAERRQPPRVGDRLHDAASVADHEEADRAEPAHRLQPPDDAHALADARRDLTRSNPFHLTILAGPAV
jgi:hypothetical protein